MRSFRDGRERRLIEDGILLDVWSETDPGFGQSRKVALVTDAEAAREVLTDIYGPGLRVVHSRWGAGVFTGLEAVIVRHEATVCSFGREIGPEEQMRLAVTALHLPRAMARELGRFPVDAVALEVRVTPAP